MQDSNANIEGRALSIPEFCERNNFSRAHFYNIVKAGIGPRVMRVGKRVLITPSAAAEWRRERETEAA